MLTAFDAVCARAMTCAAQGTPTSDRITALLASLRQTAGPGHRRPTPMADSVNVSADPSSLLSLLLSAATDWTVYRELDAAATVVARGRPPAARQAAHPRRHVRRATTRCRVVLGGRRAVRDMLGLPDRVRSERSSNDRPAVRRSTAPSAPRQSTHPETFAPWTATEWRASTADELDQCATWPASDRIDPPAGNFAGLPRRARCSCSPATSTH